MARLIFANENGRKDNEDASSGSAMKKDNKSPDVVIMTNDDCKASPIASSMCAATERLSAVGNRWSKIGSQITCHGSSHPAEYKASRVLMSESVVRRLTCQFNGCVTNGEKKKNRHLGSPLHPPPLHLPPHHHHYHHQQQQQNYPVEKAITVRNSSVQKTIELFEKDMTNKAAVTEVIKMEKKTNAELPIASVNGHAENEAETTKQQEQPPNVECGKPMVQPKPIVLQKVIAKETKLEDVSAKKMYHAAKIYTTLKDRNLVLKNKRLSIAKDFSLESVLNNDMQIKMEKMEHEKMVADQSENVPTPVPEKTAREVQPDFDPVSEPFCPDTKTANNSFLHKYLEQCVENNKTGAGEPGTDSGGVGEEVKIAPQQERLMTMDVVKNLKNSSSLHDTLMKALNGSGMCTDPNGGYEHLYRVGEGDGGQMVEDADGHHHYHYLEEHDLSNVYADVIYAQLDGHDEIENYETISSESRGNSPTTLKNPSSVSQSDENANSDSESSFEQTNSLYDSKPTSDFSSVSPSMFSLSNDCLPSKLNKSRIYLSDLKSVSSGITDEEQDADYCDSDDNDRQEISANQKRPKLFRKRKLKFLLHRKDCSQVMATTYEPENVIDDLCDDFDDSSSDLGTYDINEREENATRMDKHSISRSQSQPQNIYDFVEKAKKTVRKSFNSLTQIRKISVGNITNRNQDTSVSNTRSKSVSSVGEIEYKNGNSTTSGGSIRWPTFKSGKPKCRYSTITSSTSTFYLTPEDLAINKNNNFENVSRKQPSSNKTRRRTTCIELRVTRPTSPPPPPPPPPPPIDKLKINDRNSISNFSIYSDPSTRSSNSGSELNSELNSSRSSDLHLRFADEPLYQFYAESIAQLSTTDSFSIMSDSDGYEEIASTISRPSAMELITPSPNGHGQHRSLWCEVSEVRNSGILDTLSTSKKKIQEAIFEIITSEASYYKSLCVLDKIFANSASLRDESVLNKHDWKVLFGNVTAVKKCSEKLLAALEKCWQDSILLTGLCDVIYSHASENFQVYVKYCSNQIYIDRKLKKLKERNPKFVEIVSQLEANVACQSLNLASFLMLPMQRITRLPLLVDAVLSKMDPILDGDEYQTYQFSLVTLNKIVRDCNESTRKLERYEEMLLLSQQLEFSRKDVKMCTIASSSRWLIRSGPIEYINPPDAKLTLTKKLTKQTTKLHFFLFNDVFIVAKKKNDVPTYVVFDYCARNVVQMNLLDHTNSMLPPTISASAYRYLLMLTILENHEGKTVEMILNCDSDSTRQRWLEATSSHLASDNPDEKLYEEWDCPQVSAIHSYTAIQPDEMSLQVGDVVKVLKKTTDGWSHGERIRDGMTGWFPGNYTIEIASQHTRAKNLKLRHRLLTLSANYLQNQQKKG